MSRGDSLARQLQLMQLLDSRREIHVAEVARELGWTVRTVYRDLQVLERVGVPIYQEREARRARWRVVDGYSRRLSLTLSAAELFALSVGTQLLGGVAGGTFAPVAESAQAKLHAALPRELASRARAAARHLSARAAPEPVRAVPTTLLETLIGALEHRETVRLAYRKRGAKTALERLVDPYHLHFQAGALYLIGWCHKRRSLRTFLVDRAARATLAGTTFHRADAFDPADFLQGALGPWQGRAETVVLRFAPLAAASVAERRVHPSERLQWNADGSLDLALRAPVAPPLVAWILGWGASVQVVRPARLKALRRLELEKALAGAG